MPRPLDRAALTVELGGPPSAQRPVVLAALDVRSEQRRCVALLKALASSDAAIAQVQIPTGGAANENYWQDQIARNGITHLVWLSELPIPAGLERFAAVKVLRLFIGAAPFSEGLMPNWATLTHDSYTIEVRVELHSSDAGGRVVQRGRIGLVPWSLETSFQYALTTGADLLAKAMSGVTDSALPARPMPTTAVSASREPRRSLHRFPVMLQRMWYAAFITQGWTIGTALGNASPDGDWIKRGKLLSTLGRGDFLADPFVVPGTGGRVLLCEWMQASRGRGVIARVELDERAAIADIQLLIDWPPYHLSYPHVVEVGGVLYCCPESCHSRSVKLFELSPDARTVVSERTVLEGFPAVDPTLVHIDGVWWLFCTSAFDGRSNTHLYAFHAHNLEGPWTPHRANPIVVDVAGARPAGRIFKYGDAWYRPAQDCSRRYGGGLRLFRIERLTAESYDESPCWSVSPPVGKDGRHGVHTINCADGITVYDAYTEQFSPLAWLYRLREWVR